MECSICLEPWDYDEHVPRMLQCGHTLCEECILGFWTGEELVCHVCQRVHPINSKERSGQSRASFKAECVENIPKNFALLAAVSDQRSTHTSTDRGKSIQLGSLCETHHKQVHSYTVRPYSLVCDDCMEDLREFNLEIKPFPEIVEMTRKHLDTALKNIYQRLAIADEERHNLELLKGPKNAQKVMKTASDHFNNLLAAHDASHVQAITQLETKTRKRTDPLKDMLEEAAAAAENLEHMEEMCSMFLTFTDNETVESYSTIIELKQEAVEATLPPEVKSFSMKLKVSPQSELDYEELLHSSVRFSKKVADAYWKCENCNQLTRNGQVQCEQCGRFRPIMSYPNVVKRPMDATPAEINELQQRRDLERSLTTELMPSPETTTEWYIISAEWFNDWRNFVFNNARRNSPMLSPNPNIGVLPPGPIKNSTLFTDVTEGTLKPRLKPVANYRGVNKASWELYQKLYGGGPAIVRSKLDIYSEELR